MQLGLSLGALSLLVLGCSTVETKSSKAPGVDLSQYRTFAFAQTERPEDQGFSNPTNEARVKTAIGQQLEEHGLRPAKPAELELRLYVKRTTETYDRAKLSVGSGSLGSDLRGHYGLLYEDDWGTQNVFAYPKGTLVVQAVDVKQNRKVWQGAASGVLRQNLPEQKQEARIQEAVAGMFKDFPER